MKLAIKTAGIIIFSLLFLMPSRVLAQGVNDYVITNFDASYTLTNEDPQGLLTVTEIIDVDFGGQNQGILRAIPNEYKDNSLHLTILSVRRDANDEPYLTYEENDNTVIRIGEASEFITGVHRYVLNYQVENVISFNNKHDEFFWDINGDEWLQPLNQVSVELSTGARHVSELSPQCFTGVFGSNASNCEVNKQPNGLDASAGNLQPRETLTIVQAYEKGYFSPPSFWESNRGLLVAAPVFLSQFLVVRSAYRKWKRFGKDYRQRAVAPFYGRPKNVSVMQASYVANNRLTAKDLSAAIIDLSIRGYMKIVESKDGRKIKHTVELLKKKDSKLLSDEAVIHGALFPNQKVGDQFVIEDNKHKLSSTLTKLSSQLDAAATEKGYYEISPRSIGKHIWKQVVVAALLLAASIIIAEASTPLVVFTGVFTLAFVVGFMIVMTKRSQSGKQLKEHVDGLKLYLSKAEKDHLKMHDAVAAPLSTRGRPPKYDRQFFEKLLPFAIAMGVEKTWAHAFADIYKSAPEWYSGSDGLITTGALATSLSDTVKATSQTFSSPSSSSGSGFSSGSAGGGGGGGGGGGW